MILKMTLSDSSQDEIGMCCAQTQSLGEMTVTDDVTIYIAVQPLFCLVSHLILHHTTVAVFTLLIVYTTQMY